MIISVHIKIDSVSKHDFFLIGKFETDLMSSLYVNLIGLKYIFKTKTMLGLFWTCDYFWSKAVLERNLKCYRAFTSWANIFKRTWRNDA